MKSIPWFGDIGRQYGFRHRALLPILVIALLPFSRLAELPILIMAVLGIRELVRRGTPWREIPGWSAFCALFGCYFVPCVLASLDSVALEKSWTTTLGMLRFVPVAAWMLIRLDANDVRWVVVGGGALALLWAFDALVQAFAGVNMVGMPLSPERLNGIFGPTNIKLGAMLAVLTPLALEALHRTKVRWQVVGYVLLAMTVLLIGTRSAWVMFSVVSLASLYVYGRRARISIPVYALGATLLVVGVGAVSYQASAQFRERVDRSMQLLEADANAVDHALSQRLPIWRAAWSMVQAHPINGVGPRAFRYDYPEHVAADDPWLSEDGSTGAAHGHQLVLEVLTETGLMGLIGLLAGMVAGLHLWRNAPRSARYLALPFAVAVAAMLFPINTHLAFYSAFWSIVFWWHVMLFCVAISRPAPDSGHGRIAHG